MRIKKLTFYGVYTTLMVAAIIALIIFGCCGCATAPAFTTVSGRQLLTCERLAIREELHGMSWDKPVFRVHYLHKDIAKYGIVGHAINYQIKADGTRYYYDVAINRTVRDPHYDSHVYYDSYTHRMKGGELLPPVPEVKLGDAWR